MEPTTVAWIVAIVVAAAVAWTVSGRRARSREGGAPPESRPSRSADVGGVRTPGAAGADGGPGERDRIAREALARVHDYLRVHVLSPLRSVLGQTGKDQRARIEEAIAAVDELQVLLEERREEPERADVGTVVREVVEQFSADSPVEIDLRLPDRPVRARLSREAFQDAIFLILLNAEDFAGGRVRVELDEAGGAARLRVRDEGPGFTADSLERALEPFFSTREGALGLGLAHASRTVALHRGEIEVRNRDGGAEVEVRIPTVG